MSPLALLPAFGPAFCVATCLLLTLPWLNPFTGGPTPAVLPLLFSWICLLAVLGGGRAMVTGALQVAGGAWLVAALASAGMGLLQYFGASDALFPWVSSAAPGEAYANLRQRNQFATLMNIGLAALLWWVARPGTGALAAGFDTTSYVTPHAKLNVESEAKSYAEVDARPDGASRAPTGLAIKLACALAAALLTAGNAASSSRTGLVQLLLLLALAGLWAQWRRPEVRPLLFVAALAYGLASISLPYLAGLDVSSSGILARFSDGDSTSACASRLTLWQNVLHLIAQKPWLGWGWGELDYAHFTTLYEGPRFCEILDNAHNLPLHLAVELGVPVAILLCGAVMWAVWRAKPWREADITRQMAWSVLALIALHSLLEYPLWYGPFQMAVLLCIGMLWRKPAARVASARSTQNSKKWLNMPFFHVLYRFFAILIIVFVIFSVWDYRRISQIYLPPESRAPAYQGNTLMKIQDSWLFRSQARFALLTLTPASAENAEFINRLAHQVLHFSPEARVVEKLIDTALLLGRNDEAQFYAARFRAAYPAEHEAWARRNGVR